MTVRHETTFHPWLKAVALFTAIIFLTTSIVSADQLQSIRVKAPLLSPDLPSPHQSPMREEFAALPESLGQVKRMYQGRSDRIVVHIQDAHVNEEAQHNIAAILDYFAQNHQLQLVNLEGAEGELYTSLFTAFPNKKARQNIADYFLKAGRLTGPEYLAIVERPDMVLFGVEDRAIYEKNRNAYL